MVRRSGHRQGLGPFAHYIPYEEPAQTESKPSNHKDIIGIRKVPMSAIPAGVMMEVALALGEGAAKYAAVAAITDTDSV